MNKAPWIFLCVASAAFVPFACGGSSSTTTTSGAGGSTTTSTTTTTHTTTGTTATATSGATSGGGASTSSCDAPAKAPSNGTCYKGASTTSSTTSTTTTTTSSHSSSASSSSSHSSSVSGSSSHSSSSGGTSASCSGYLADGTCSNCLEASCCDSLAACHANSDCFGCLTGTITDTATCGSSTVVPLFNAVNSCLTSACGDECSNAPCNPVTNDGCDTSAGEACDISSDSGFVCFPSGNDTPICQACDNADGPFCEAGLHCQSDGTCARYCCDDGDCGTGKCDKTQLTGETSVGVCILK